MSSTSSAPFAFSRATATTPQSKSTSTHESHETRSTGNMETASSSPSGGSPTLAVSPSSSVPSPQDVRGTPMPPCHPTEVANSALRQRHLPPCLHRRAVLRPRGHDKRSRGTVGSFIRADPFVSDLSLIHHQRCWRRSRANRPCCPFSSASHCAPASINGWPAPDAKSII